MMGVENLILIDYDKVELSNTARQILYDESDVGKLKIDVAKEKIKKYTVLNSYILSISSMIGGLFGSLLYGYIQRKMEDKTAIYFHYNFDVNSYNICHLNTFQMGDISCFTISCCIIFYL